MNRLTMVALIILIGLFSVPLLIGMVGFIMVGGNTF